MAAPNPFNRFPPSGPPLDANFGTGAILQFDTRPTEYEGEEVGPAIDTAPGTVLPVLQGRPPRIGRPRAASRMLVEFGCSVRLLDWNGTPTITASLEVSQNEGGIWLALGTIEYDFEPIADTGGAPALQTQKAWMRGQQLVPSSALFGALPGPTIIARVMLIASVDTPEARIYARQSGEAYISLAELEGAASQPAP